MSAPEALALRGVCRAFGTTRALDDAACTVRHGTIHALLGENGAGKTTLMRIAFGALSPDSGQILLDGAPVHFRSSADAIARGIGMVHQHFMLVPALSVAENIALGGRGRLNLTAISGEVRAIGRDSGLNVDPLARLDDLPVSAQQRVEIVRALARKTRILILDEPTAVLTPAEAADLMRWLRQYADAGGTVVLITHKLREALEIADDITVLRNGRTALAVSRAAVSEARIVSAIVGDATPATLLRPPSRAPTVAKPLFVLKDVSSLDARGTVRLRTTNLTVLGGDIVGVLGVEGSGQRELLRILAGRLHPTHGRVQRPARVGFIPEDRLRDALIPNLSLVENVALAEAGHLRGLVDWSAMTRRTRNLVTEYDIRTHDLTASISTLSGGNQQKFVIGRERMAAPTALVAENPTRGLDIRAASQVLEDLAAASRNQGSAVIFHSSDLDEVLSLATRIVVCFDGHVREMPPPDGSADRTPYARALTGAV